MPLRWADSPATCGIAYPEKIQTVTRVRLEKAAHYTQRFAVLQETSCRGEADRLRTAANLDQRPAGSAHFARDSRPPAAPGDGAGPQHGKTAAPI